MLEIFKPLYERVLRPALSLFQRVGIRPNHLTLAGVVLFGAAGWSCAVGRWYAALGLVVAAGLTDGWDGLLARETGQETRFGGILDSTCDRIAETLLLAGLLVYYERAHRFGATGVYLSYAAITGSLMVSYVKARCEGQGIACRGGMLQRPERIILLCLFLLLGPRAMLYGLGVISVLAYFTVLQRTIIGYRACARGTADRREANKEV
jgi:CDP-diacylglycerol---glycerol-3-phosphate 3-phosphatidyltransferase